jgi:serine/threonine protein phosphatase 1
MGLKNLVSSWRRKGFRHFVAPGQRRYAIGDIHGRYDLLNQLIAMIEADNEARGPADTRLLFLGDYVDRGPESRQVIEAMMELDIGDDRVIFLGGNHEEVLLATAEGNRRAAALFHRLGGRETLLSYGAGAQDYDHADPAGLVDLLRVHVPGHHLQWMRGLRDCYREGDYLFVHAGMRPGIAIEDQKSSDMRWIRSEFLDHPASHGPLVIHGHSVTSRIDERPNRIGIDTGAYASGVLTAVGLEANQRWFLQTRPR